MKDQFDKDFEKYQRKLKADNVTINTTPVPKLIKVAWLAGVDHGLELAKEIFRDTEQA